MAPKRKTTSGDTEDDEKMQEKRREQNRMAAQKCRDKKKDHCDRMLKQVQQLQSEQTTLTYQRDQVKRERDELRQIFEAHRRMCPVFNQQFLSSQVHIARLDSSVKVSATNDTKRQSRLVPVNPKHQAVPRIMCSDSGLLCSSENFKEQKQGESSSGPNAVAQDGSAGARPLTTISCEDIVAAALASSGQPVTNFFSENKVSSETTYVHTGVQQSLPTLLGNFNAISDFSLANLNSGGKRVSENDLIQMKPTNLPFHTYSVKADQSTRNILSALVPEKGSFEPEGSLAAEALRPSSTLSTVSQYSDFSAEMKTANPDQAVPSFSDDVMHNLLQLNNPTMDSVAYTPPGGKESKADDVPQMAVNLQCDYSGANEMNLCDTMEFGIDIMRDIYETKEF